MDKIPKETFKDNLSRMFEVESLCTAPAKQGRGYGSALVRFVTGQVNRPYAIANIGYVLIMNRHSRRTPQAAQHG